VQEQFTWDTITEQMLAIYQELCLSPAILPHRVADSVRAVLAESSRATSRAGPLDESLLASINEKGTQGPRISMQAKLHFVTADHNGVPRFPERKGELC
jgi:hypothetical protein